jgi:hypothetical protein
MSIGKWLTFQKIELAWWLGHRRYSLGKKAACRFNQLIEDPPEI